MTTTCTVLCRSPLFCQNSSVRSVNVWISQGMWMCPLVWSTEASSARSLCRASCTLETPWIRLFFFFFITSHRCTIGMRSGEMGGQCGILNSLSCSSKQSWTMSDLWVNYSAERGRCHQGKLLPLKDALDYIIEQFTLALLWDYIRWATLCSHISKPSAPMSLSAVHQLSFLGPLLIGTPHCTKPAILRSSDPSSRPVKDISIHSLHAFNHFSHINTFNVLMF